MQHPQIENEDVIERYLRGKLSAAQTQEFEKHYLSCEACLEQLENAESFARAMKNAAQRGLLEDAEPEPAAPTRWLALAALLLLACGLPLYLLEQQRRSSEAGRADAQQKLAGVEQKLAQSEAEKADLQRRLATPPPAPAPKIEASLLPVFLGALRSNEGEPAVELAPPPETDTILLIFELQGPDLPAYQARLLKADEELWKGENLHPNDLGLTLAVPRSLLAPGVYRLEIQGSRNGREIPVGSSAFRVR